MTDCNLIAALFTTGLVLSCVALTLTSSDNKVSFEALLARLSASLIARGEPVFPDQTLRLDGSALQSLENDITDSGDIPRSILGDGSALGGPQVQTKYGVLKGLTVDKAHIFYGVPFADPPVGERRWKPPTPPTPWKEVRDATFPRPGCMQTCSGPIYNECPTEVSEDCLYLNIFVPLDVDFKSPLLTPLPVMVWIHGGDFIAGSASKPLYDGRFIANFTRTVVVNLEYRLGAFGFLVSGKNPKASAVGNYGLLDQQAALLWVQQNIAGFGGDPSRVTIFGESAGAQSVCLHLMLQSSQPLFQQAVCQSLPFSIPLKTRHEARKLGKHFAKLANCSAKDWACLQALTSQEVLAAQVKAGSKIVNPFRFLELFESWGPYIDGELIKEQSIAAFQKGHWQKDKPVLLGTTSEEGVIFVYGVFTKPVSALECTVYTTAIFKQHALRILHKYIPLYQDADRRSMLSQIVTDYVFLCPSRRAARAAAGGGGAAWLYVFDHAAADPRVWSGLRPCYGRVCHGAELPFLFGSAAVANFSLTPPEQLLANRMLCYWGAFARGGDPSPAPPAAQTPFCREQRPVSWPRYSGASADSWALMNLTLASHAQPGFRDQLCDFWDKLGVY
ncbi:cAMP-regulated D2 protein-like [Anguilla anguilla]|uniref:cAMP-regulated D2 protein-like n=1 Tax=Anguilla anguilla TaxID=7936 RepID=UPI0015A7BAA0|nr:cAMP-regulated D2 protein-like [Anguilla anguilla]